MQDVVRAQAELQRAQEREKDALDRAAVAIQEAARTKQLRLYAWIALAEARGAKDNFKPAYSEFMHLQHLQDHGVCQSVVQKVLSCGFWSTLGTRSFIGHQDETRLAPARENKATQAVSAADPPNWPALP